MQYLKYLIVYLKINLFKHSKIKKEKYDQKKKNSYHISDNQFYHSMNQVQRILLLKTRVRRIRIMRI